MRTVKFANHLTLKEMETSKKLIAISLIAATASVATYIYFKKKQEAKKKNLPVTFI